MQYPIFQAIINRIQSSLKEREIHDVRARIWTEKEIHATGLEIKVDLSDQSPWIKEASIHFDWDSFRERSLAKQLKGTSNHPFLSIPFLKSSTVPPNLDVEVSWAFDLESFQVANPNSKDLVAIDAASRWMEEINQILRTTFSSRSLLSRWHIEIMGDEKGRTLSSAQLITYYQFSLEHLKSLQDVHKTIDRRLIQLLFISRKVVESANGVLSHYAAA
jgi:hypothetical protein